MPITPHDRRRTPSRVRKFDMIEFVRPDGNSFWPYTLEQAFHVMQCAIAQGHTVGENARWGFSGLSDLLLGGGGCNSSHAISLSNVKDIKKAFHRLLLSRTNPTIDAWKSSSGFHITGTAELKFQCPSFEGGFQLNGNPSASANAVEEALTRLLTQFAGKRLPVSLNSCHLTANTIEAITVEIRPQGFVFLLTYQLHGSHWSSVLAETVNDEPFTITLSRAISHIETLMNNSGSADDHVARLMAQKTMMDCANHNWPTRNTWVNLDSQVVLIHDSSDDVDGSLRFFSYHQIGYRPGAYIFDRRTNRQIFTTPNVAPYDWPRIQFALDDLNAADIPNSEADIESLANHLYDETTVKVLESAEL